MGTPVTTLTQQRHVRPYWHVDAKWVCGLLFFASLTATLFLYTLSTLTRRDIAVPATTYVVANMFSRNGLDDTTEINEIKQNVKNIPGESYSPVSGATVPKSDLYTLSPRQFRLKAFEQVVAPIYDRTPTASGQTTSDQDLMKQAGVLAFLNKNTHAALQNAFLAALTVAALLLPGLVFFSHRLGRLVSPGLVMVLAALPGAILAGLLTIAVTSQPPYGGPSGPLSYLPPETLVNLSRALAPVLIGVFALGLALLLIAATAKLVWRPRHKAAA
jgi:hypothetical protein